MIRRVLTSIAVVGLGAMLAGHIALRGSLPVLDGEIRLDGLGARVSVQRDAYGVPTIRGGNRIDVARATGFVHAQDRFFQMDLARRNAAGELSALIGPAALPIDRKRRLHRLRPIARRIFGELPEHHRALLLAYAEGINQGLARLPVRPPEYLLLRTPPAPWLPEDSLLVIHAMHLQLADVEASHEARKAVLHECLPAPAVGFLTTNDAAWAATVDGGSLVQSPLPGPAEFDLRRLAGADFEVGRTFAETVAAEPDLPVGNSNAWAVAGTRTADGRALVANDMHLKLRVANVWYPMRLVVQSRASPMEVTGVTLPGTPSVVAGSNGKVAWGFTNSYGDWADRIPLELDPADPARYRTADGYRRFEEHDERIEIEGADAVALPVRWTAWGPVLYDHRNRPIALRSLVHAPEATNLRLADLERATDVGQALDIAVTSGIPPQNIVVADAAGNVGWTIAGRIPRRESSGSDPPDERTAGNGEWLGWLSPEEYPRIENPPGGHIWTANHPVVSGAALAMLGDSGYWHGARARQIRDALRGLDRATERDMLAIQLDDRALLLARWQELLMSLLTPELIARHPRAAEFRVTVGAWNGHAHADSAAYRLVHAFRARVRDVAFAAITAPCRALDPKYRFEGFRQHEGPLWTLVKERPLHLLNPRFGDWEAQLRAIVLETIEYFDRYFEGPFARRTWGEYNTLSMRHPLSRAVPWLAPFLDMPATPLSGDRHVPRVQTPEDGASERFAVAPGRERDGYFHMPGGQSGHPLSPYYRRGHGAWLRGEPRPFLPGAAEHRLHLLPAGR